MLKVVQLLKTCVFRFSLKVASVDYPTVVSHLVVVVGLCTNDLKDF